MNAGDTFLLYDEFVGQPAHLHVVLHAPDGEGRIVLVSITTRRSKSDTMVCISAGEHPFIEHDSVVTYAYSKLLTVSKIEELVREGEAFPKEAVSPFLLNRICAGMVETDRAPREVQNFFRSLL